MCGYLAKLCSVGIEQHYDLAWIPAGPSVLVAPVFLKELVSPFRRLATVDVAPRVWVGSKKTKVSKG